MESLIIVERAETGPYLSCLRLNLILNEKMSCCCFFFVSYIFFHVLKLLALDFKEKILIFSMGFLEKIISLLDSLCFNESFGKAIYVKMNRQESAVR